MTNDLMMGNHDQCFLCLDQISQHVDETNLQFKLEDEPVPMASSSSLPIYSLHQLTRYLQLDMRKVFYEGGLSFRPQELLGKRTGPNLNVVLCKECANRNTAMSKLFRQLEKIKLEITSYLELVHGKLLSAAAANKNPNFSLPAKFNEPISDSGSTGKLNIVNLLRAEMLEKCSSKLGTIQPRVAVKKLTSKEWISRTKPCNKPIPSYEKEDSEKLSDPEIEPCDIVKTEITDAEESALWTPFEDNKGSSHFNEMSREEIQASSGRLTAKNEIDNPDSGRIYWERDTNGHYPCKICKKTFSQSSNCKRHIQNVHKGKRYNCEDCNRTFTQKDSLVYHKRLSCAGVKRNKSSCQHRCHICGKGFNQRKVLRCHVKLVHLRLGQSKCDQCAQTFSSPDSLRTHFKVVHLQLREYSCPICGMKFKRKNALQGHQRAWHKKVESE